MNLLPETEKMELKRGLKHRSLIIMFVLAGTAFLLGLIMLLPSYFLARAHLSSSELGALQLKANEEGESVLNLPNEIKSKLGLLQTTAKSIQVADSITKIVELLPEDIKIDSFSFDRNYRQNDVVGVKILISGKAANRDALAKFGDALKDSGLFSEVSIPVSNFAQDINLPFSINIFEKLK